MHMRTAILRNFTFPLLAAAMLVFLAARAYADSVTFYTSRSSFDSAEPSLPVEGFEAAHVTAPTLATQTAPLSNTTNNTVFSSGSILPGVSISNIPAADTPGLIVYPNGYISGSSKSVGTNWFGDTLLLSFDSGVTAVGSDVFAATGQGLTLPGSFSVQVLNGATLLGQTTFSEALGAFGFIGLSSTSPITSIRLLYLSTDASTFVDNLAFGGATSSPPPVVIPDPGLPAPPPGVPDPGAPGTPNGPDTPSAATPEPSTLTLVALSSGLLGLCRRAIGEGRRPV